MAPKSWGNKKHRYLLSTTKVHSLLQVLITLSLIFQVMFNQSADALSKFLFGNFFLSSSAVFFIKVARLLIKLVGFFLKAHLIGFSEYQLELIETFY